VRQAWSDVFSEQPFSLKPSEVHRFPEPKTESQQQGNHFKRFQDFERSRSSLRGENCLQGELCAFHPPAEYVSRRKKLQQVPGRRGVRQTAALSIPTSRNPGAAALPHADIPGAAARGRS